jgi:nucleotide-binding universal stress UspA family protein
MAQKRQPLPPELRSTSKKTSSELHIVRVWPIVQPAQIEQEARTLLNEQVEEIKAAAGAIAQAHLRMGGAAEEIVKMSEEIGAGLVVIGSRGLGGMRRARMGSVSESVVRHSHCPVFWWHVNIKMSKRTPSNNLIKAAQLVSANID